MNKEIPDVQAEFRKDRGTRDQIVNIRWIIEKVREKICFINYAKVLIVWITTICRKFFKITLPVSWKTYKWIKKQQLKTLHGTNDWFKIEKGVHQGCILSHCLLTSNKSQSCHTGLDESKARIKISGRNINNLKYADDITLMTKSEEELKSLLMRVKRENEKRWLKTQHPK